jgi:hypothetical protein
MFMKKKKDIEVPVSAEAETSLITSVTDEKALAIAPHVESGPSPENALRLAVVKGLSRDRIEEMRNQLALLQEFVAKVMIRGEHYGIIPGTSKPTLLKAGAEFLREAYGFEVRSECVDKKFTRAAETENNRDYVEFTYRVELLQNGLVVGICEGSCNNYERRYEKLSPFAVMNTIQKMAQKRAYVGAVISATRSSNIFTQDLEDAPELATNANDGHDRRVSSSKTQAGSGVAPLPTAAGPAASLRMATPGQAKLIWARLKNELGLNDFAAREFISSHSGKAHSRDLTAEDVEKLLNAIDTSSAAKRTEDVSVAQG